MPRFKPKGGKKGGAGKGKKSDEWPARLQGGADDGRLARGNPSNPAFEAYYRGQGFIPEEEFEAFTDILKKDLPTTFRVTGSRAHAETINNHILTTYTPFLQNVILDGEPQPAPKQLDWYPGNLAWQLNVPKRTIRKSPEYKMFQTFLVGETEIGNISRQEAVSMIPPLLLDVQPHHFCLDMCAAPGSKTAQILEALNPHDAPSTGILLANDSDSKRCHMLVHQTGRMPSLGLGVTNNDASAFPSLKMDEAQNQNLKFDRILADVPCTGDGTMRKNPDIWNHWSVANANSLHSLQLRILIRALQLLKPDGKMVYSTCSFNPVENEAVVAAAFNAFPGQFRIVDQSAALPGLKRRKGLSTWKVGSQSTGNDVVWHDSYAEHLGFVTGCRGSSEEIPDQHNDTPEFQSGKAKAEEWKANGGASFKGKVWLESTFPPANSADLGLEHCLRLLPHDQDTGGFFVCAIERIPKEGQNGNVQAKAEAGEAEIKAGIKRAVSPSAPSGREEGESSKKARLEGDSGVNVEESKPIVAKAQAKPKPKQGRADPAFKEDPFFFIEEQDAELQACIKYFNLSPDFPKDRCFVRNGSGDVSRTIYLANAPLKSIINGNDYTHAHLLSAGIKIFCKQDSKQSATDIMCKWRIPADGLTTMVPYLDPSMISHADIDDLKILLQHQYPTINGEVGGLMAKMKEKSPGCHIVTFAPHDGKDGRGQIPLPLMLPIWRGVNSLSLLIDKKEKGTLSQRTFGKNICEWAGTLKQQAKVAADAENNVDEETTGEAPAIAQGEEAAEVEETLMNDA